MKSKTVPTPNHKKLFNNWLSWMKANPNWAEELLNRQETKDYRDITEMRSQAATQNSHCERSQ